ncbi:MAG: glycine oxidase ThiO [Chloroflexota bacterium]|nr:glycine oxidase ThiO [Chloroflexota bacterium]
MSDVVIVGGGVVGLASAYELSRAGAEITLLEYGKTGMQATNAAAGMLAPLIEAHDGSPMLRIGLRALRAYPALVDELERIAGFGLEFRPHGILKVAFDEAGLAELHRRVSWQRDFGLPIDALDAASCRELEPRLSRRVAGGVFSSSEGSVSSQLLALALERAAAAAGAVIHNGAPVTGFERAGDRVVAVRSRDRSFPCDAVVLAAGARSGQIARLLRIHLPVRPVRGQMIALGGMLAPVQHIVWGPDGYLVPRANGLIFAGATVEEVGFRRRTTVAGVRAMRRMARTLVPQLASATVHFAWAGLRPGSPDGLPIIGPLPAYPNVIAATGHYRNGILLGPLTGALVARGICEGDWSAVPPEFRPGRF